MSLTLPEGVTANEVNPQPPFWPQCDDAECETPYILRRALSFGTGKWTWVWMRDCKHDKRKAQPGAVVANDDGPVVSSDA